MPHWLNIYCMSVISSWKNVRLEVRSVPCNRISCPIIFNNKIGFIDKLFWKCTHCFVWSFQLDGLFSWSRAVQIRTNLDLVLDWLQGAGLGDIASEFMKKLSVTVNFLCIPKTRLIQVIQLHVEYVFWVLAKNTNRFIFFFYLSSSSHPGAVCRQTMYC